MTKPDKPIPYGRHNITEKDIQSVVETLQSNNLTQEPKIAEFEKKFAEYIGCKYAVAVANGTVALHLCAMAVDVKEGDKVISTPVTFSASANCIRYCGGEVVFSDINPDTYLTDYDKVEELVKSKPKGTFKGIIPLDILTEILKGQFDVVVVAVRHKEFEKVDLSGLGIMNYNALMVIKRN